MPEPNQAKVTEEASPTSTETQQPSETQQAETTAAQEQVAEEQTTTEQTQEVKTQPQQTLYEPMDERGIPWKNRAMEAERKANEIPQIIRQTVEELTQSQQKPKYTIEQLEQYAIENPQHRPWVEAQKATLIQENLKVVLKGEMEAKERQTQEIAVRQQSEQWVVAHPKFKDCFVTDAGGRKSWNMANPLTHVIGNYLNQVDPATGKLVKDRPDGLVVAAKMAYADHSLNMEPQTIKKVTQLQKDLRKSQKSQMIPAGNAQSTVVTKSNVRKSLDNYNKSYNKSDIQAATKSFLLASGLIKEE